MLFSLENKIAVITGGASGVGLACAHRFSSAGARIAVFDLMADRPASLEDKWLYNPVDVSNGEELKTAFKAVYAALGNIDVLINNAGINGDDGRFIADSDDALTRKVLEVNMFGVLNGLKHAPQFMSNGGAIVNTSSLGGSYVFPGSGPYSASKAAVNSLTQMAAAELSPRKIRVNAVAPGFIRTPLAQKDITLFDAIGARMTHAGEIANPEEVAAVFHFLASDDARYVNGQIIAVDSGMSSGMTLAEVESLQ
jgi:NAD(P)-dependent dehydrogenase (short-subunit alcohol dehydrogenase family)